MHPKIDIRFRLTGTEIPADHGYHLLAALSSHLPYLHANNGVGIHPIMGRYVGGRRLALTEHSYLTIRLPKEDAAEVVNLAGQTVTIAAASLVVGVPEVRLLEPAETVFSRLVVIKGFTQPEPFLDAVRRQLDSMEVTGHPELVEQANVVEANRDRAAGSHSPFLRRTVEIRGRQIVGFALRVKELSPADSIRLQEEGIGGRRRFGCGLFVPDSRQMA